MSRRVLIVYAHNTDEILNRKSALGSYIYCLAGLLDNGTTSIFINGKPYQELQEKQDSITTAPVSKGKLNFIKQLIPRKVKLLLKDKQKLKQINLLYNQLESQSFDHIIEFLTYGSDVGLKLSKSKKIPLTVIYDSPIMEQYRFFEGMNSPLYSKIDSIQKEVLEQAKNIVVYSNPVKEFLKKEMNLSVDNFFIHQNIDFSRFHLFPDKQESNTTNIGFIGSFLKWHRVDLLIDVFEELQQLYPSTHLYLVGKGLEYENIKHNVSNSLCKDKITLTGYLDGEALLNIKKKMHVGVMPSSNWYGAPNKLFEYMAMGMVCVAPETPTISDVFDDQLVYFKNNDRQSLYLALKKLLSDKEQLDSLKHKGMEFIKSNYSAEKTTVFYQQLLK